MILDFAEEKSVLFSKANLKNGKERSNESVNTLTDSVAKSNEFSDFVIDSDLLLDKFVKYKKKLTNAEFDELMYNQNNDEYLEQLIFKSGIKNEIRAVMESKNNLLKNTNYLKLDKSVQSNLLFSDKIVVKTRSEGNSSNDCDSRRQADYSWARAKADAGLILCTCSVEVPLIACICYATVLLNYAYDLRHADQSYEDCMKNKK